SESVFAELTYGGSQRAYLMPAVSDYSLQLHRAAAALEVDLSHRLRLGASAGLALDEGEHTSTRLDASFARKVGLSEFTYLTGNRLDATLSQELRLDG